MKKYIQCFFCAFLILFAHKSNLNAQNSNLIIKSDQAKFLLTVNGEIINEANSSNIKYSFMPGLKNVSLKIFPNKGVSTILKSNVTLDANYDHVFVLVLNNNEWNLRLDDILPFSGKVVNNNSDNNNNNNNNNQVVVDITNKYYPPSGWSNPMPSYSGTIGCPYPLSNNELESLKKAISSKTFESSKMETAKSIIQNNCLTTFQIKEISELFSFESSKLEFAKLAYPHAYDISNYQSVTNDYTFSSNKEDLEEYVGKNQNIQFFQNGILNPNYPGNQGLVTKSTQGCQNLIQVSEFNDIMKKIQIQRSDNSRMTIVKQNLGVKCFDSEQIKQILKLFTFDVSKLEIAKLAYPTVFDKNNYYKLNETFTSSFSVKELSDFVKKQK